MRLFNMRLGISCIFLVTLGPTCMGEVTGRLELHELASDVFGNTRTLRVWLPYDEPAGHDGKYRVLYLNDGQDVFDASESLYFSTEWRVDETLTSMIADDTIEAIIVVGIDNGGRASRSREYLPWPDAYLSPPESSPSGSLYAEFLEAEVMPLIEARYPVRTDKAGRTLGGSSYGALIALHVALSRPELFGQLLLESPSLYVDDFHVLNDVEREGMQVERVYFGAGTNEGGGEGCGVGDDYLDVAKDVLELSHILINQGLTGNQIRVNIEPCANHSPAAWARRLPTALSFLFGDPAVSLAH